MIGTCQTHSIRRAKSNVFLYKYNIIKVYSLYIVARVPCKIGQFLIDFTQARGNNNYWFGLYHQCIDFIKWHLDETQKLSLPISIRI